METSILKSTKKILGLADDYTVYDHDILTHINTAFSTLTQLGVGPDAGFVVEDDTVQWASFIGTDTQLQAVKSYVYLRVRLMFDPPQTSFHLSAAKDQIEQLEWRLNAHREETEWTDPNPPVVEEEVP